jgi:hypothetical protein
MTYHPDSEGGGAIPPSNDWLSNLIALGSKAVDRLSEEAIVLSAIIFFKVFMQWQGVPSEEVDRTALPFLYAYLYLRTTRLFLEVWRR